MNLRDGRLRFLASVANAAEAELCVAAGAGVIDCKNPSRGALGALDSNTVRAIRAAVPGHIPVSATIGDLPSDPEPVAQAVKAMAGTGAEYVKIGIFPGGDPEAMIARTGDLSLGPARLVGVLLADLDPQLALLSAMARAGYAGVLFDTANKASPALPDLVGGDVLARFVAMAHDHGLFAGLAGSLRLRHIPGLTELAPDVLGFRGALCRDHERTGEIDPGAISAVAAALAKHQRARERMGESLTKSPSEERRPA